MDQLLAELVSICILELIDISWAAHVKSSALRSMKIVVCRGLRTLEEVVIRLIKAHLFN